MRALSNTAVVEQAAKKALSAQQLEKTLLAFRQLCLTPGDDTGALEQVAETLRNAGFRRELMDILRETLTRPEVNPHVGAIWIRRSVTSKFWDHRYPESLDELCQRGEVGHRAVIEFLQILGAKRRYALIRQTIARHRKWLRSDPQGWSAAGRALVQARCYRQAAQWMADWRKKPDLDLETLHSLTLALRASGRTKQANEVARVVVERPGALEQFPMFKLWQAEDLAFSGDTEGASNVFKTVNPAGWDDDALAAYYLVRSVIRVQKAERSNRGQALTTALERLRDLFRRRPIYKRDVYLRRQYRRCVTRMARDAGAWPEAIRARWRSAESWPFALVLLVVPGLQLFLPVYLYRLLTRRHGVSGR